MNAEAKEKIYDSLMEVAPPIFDKYFAPRRCIAATKIGIAALAYFGIKAKPLPVNITVFNPEYAALTTAGVIDPGELLARGAYVVAIDEGNHSGGYGGHLVIEVADGIMDLNFGQFSRPLKNMALPDTAAFKELDKRADCFYPINNCIARIRASDDTIFKKAPDWRRSDRAIIGEVIRAIKKEQ